MSRRFFFIPSASLFPFSRAASVAILPSALFCERYSLSALPLPKFHATGQRARVIPQFLERKFRDYSLVRSHLLAPVGTEYHTANLSRIAAGPRFLPLTTYPAAKSLSC